MSKENKLLILLGLIMLIINGLAFYALSAKLSNNYTESELDTMGILLIIGSIVMILAGNEVIKYLKRD